MLNSRIAAFIQHLEISTNEFERTINAGRGSISGAIKHDRNIGSNIVESILQVYKDLNSDWLLRGTGEMLNKSADRVSDKSSNYEVSVGNYSYSAITNPLLNEIIEQLNEKVKSGKLRNAEEVLDFIKDFAADYRGDEDTDLRLLRLESSMAKLLLEFGQLKQLKKL